jgi:hypothetical protein
VPKAAKSAVSMHAMATRRKNISIAVSDGSPAEPIGRTSRPRGYFGIETIGVATLGAFSTNVSACSGVIRSSWIACDFQALPAEQRMIGLRDARLPSMNTI